MQNKPLHLLVLGLVCALLLAACSREPLTTHEKGGLLGGALGAGSGAIIGAAVGHPWAGAAIGGPIGLVAGGVIGDSLMGLEHRERRLRSKPRQSHELAHQGPKSTSSEPRRRQNRNYVLSRPYPYRIFLG